MLSSLTKLTTPSENKSTTSEGEELKLSFLYAKLWKGTLAQRVMEAAGSESWGMPSVNQAEPLPEFCTRMCKV